MLYQTFLVPSMGESSQAELVCYLVENMEDVRPTETRPFVLICPGGGYSIVSKREADPIAFEYLAAGYHVGILYYSCHPALYPTALKEVAWSIATIRRNAREWFVNQNQIIVSGFSAGGHLAASFATTWNTAEGLEEYNDDRELIRPNGLILSYPVITSGEFAHKESFENLLGNQYESEKQNHSLEFLVNKETPKTFLWHTFEDDTVPVENALLFAQALRKKEIPFELHIYPVGGHGISLADERTGTTSMEDTRIVPECQGWMDLSIQWIKSQIEGKFLKKV